MERNRERIEGQKGRYKMKQSDREYRLELIEIDKKNPHCYREGVPDKTILTSVRFQLKKKKEIEKLQKVINEVAHGFPYCNECYMDIPLKEVVCEDCREAREMI